MQAQGEIHFFHSIRHRQRHVPARVEKNTAPVNAGAAGKIRGPLRVSCIERDRFAAVIERGADDLGVRVFVEESHRASEVIGIDRVGVVVKTRD